MAMITIPKGYLDDSGDESDPQHSVLTVAGYIGTISGWEWFEHNWPQVMERHGVPYLHMKELWNRDGIYKALKERDGAEADFLADCIKTIATGTEHCISASIRLADLRAFNSETGLNLDPVALAIYGCIIELRAVYPDGEMQVIVDRITKPHRRIEIALQYARTDTYADLKADTRLCASGRAV